MSSLTLESIDPGVISETQILFNIDLHDEMKKHLHKVYPSEGCGFLLGIHEHGLNKLVTEIIPVQNLNQTHPERQFEINPIDTLRIERYAQEKGLSVLGIYHSHPDHPSRPSAADLAFAQPGWSYFIQTVGYAYLDKLSSWILKEDLFIEEKIIITN